MPENSPPHIAGVFSRSILLSVEYLNFARTDAVSYGTSGSGSRGIPLVALLASEDRLVPYEESGLPFYLNEVRNALFKQRQKRIPIPEDFCFASIALTPVDKDVEKSVPWSAVVTSDLRILICRVNESSYYFVENHLRMHIGTLQVFRDEYLSTIRESITSTLLTGTELRMENFLFPNNMLVRTSEENTMTLLNISSFSRKIRVATAKKENAIPYENGRTDAATDVPDFPLDSARSSRIMYPSLSRQQSALSPCRSRKNVLKHQLRLPALDRRVSFNSSKNLSRTTSPLTRNKPPKKFLISYVSSEGRGQAILLKNELERHGCTVFLDIENIICGLDWQDILNSAVMDCEVFVPLITDSYGETTWTNREIKLADVMKKTIVPVSLIRVWPPQSLAIQFSSIQYVAWRSENEFDTPGCTPPEVEQHRVRDVAKQVMDLYRALKLEGNVTGTAPPMEVSTPPFRFASAKRARRSTLRSYPYESRHGGMICEALEEAQRPKEGRPFILVCAHPAQRAFIDAVRKDLQPTKFDIWSTADTSALWPDHIYQESLNPPAVSQSVSRISDVSGFSSQSSESSPSEIVGALFRERADESAAVVLVLSAAFATNATCKPFFYYVERRKRLLLVKFDDFKMPAWMITLIGANEVLDCNASDFTMKLRAKVHRAVNLLDHAERAEEDLTEANIARGMQFLENNNIPRDRTVYISGSGSNGIEAAFLSKAIAAELGTVPLLCIATGGNTGAAEALSCHFQETARPGRGHRKSGNVFHVLPVRDVTIQSEISNQNLDGTFGPAKSGKSFFVGNSLQEREMIVGRYFKVIILIDGDAHAAHEAQEAMWADNIVLPVYKSGGAAAGDFELRTEKAPSGVSDEQWAVLRSLNASNEEIAVVIREILEILLPAVGRKKVKAYRTPRVAPCTPVTPHSAPYSLRGRKPDQKRTYGEVIIGEEQTSSESSGSHL